MAYNSTVEENNGVISKKINFNDNAYVKSKVNLNKVKDVVNDYDKDAKLLDALRLEAGAKGSVGPFDLEGSASSNVLGNYTNPGLAFSAAVGDKDNYIKALYNLDKDSKYKNTSDYKGIEGQATLGDLVLKGKYGKNSNSYGNNLVSKSVEAEYPLTDNLSAKGKYASKNYDDGAYKEKIKGLALEYALKNGLIRLDAGKSRNEGSNYGISFGVNF